MNEEEESTPHSIITDSDIADFFQLDSLDITRMFDLAIHLRPAKNFFYCDFVKLLQRICPTFTLTPKYMTLKPMLTLANELLLPPFETVQHWYHLLETPEKRNDFACYWEVLPEISYGVPLVSRNNHSFALYYSVAKTNGIDPFIKQDFSDIKMKRIGLKPILISIAKDDLDALRAYLAEPNRTVDDKCLRMPLIQYAEICGSIRCFRHLLINGADRDGIVGTSLHLARAIAGANLEIIQLLYEFHPEYPQNAIGYAIFCHRNELAKLFIEKDLLLTDRCLANAFFSRNFHFLYYALENPELFPPPSDCNEIAINLAAKGDYTMIDYLYMRFPFTPVFQLLETGLAYDEIVNFYFDHTTDLHNRMPQIFTRYLGHYPSGKLVRQFCSRLGQNVIISPLPSKFFILTYCLTQEATQIVIEFGGNVEKSLPNGYHAMRSLIVNSFNMKDLSFLQYLHNLNPTCFLKNLHGSTMKYSVSPKMFQFVLSVVGIWKPIIFNEQLYSSCLRNVLRSSNVGMIRFLVEEEKCTVYPSYFLIPQSNGHQYLENYMIEHQTERDERCFIF